MKTRSHHDVSVRQPVEKGVDLFRIVLTVGVHLHNRVESFSLRVQEGCAHRSTYTHVEGQGEDDGPGVCRLLSCVVHGTVINNHDSCVR